VVDIHQLRDGPVGRASPPPALANDDERRPVGGMCIGIAVGDAATSDGLDSAESKAPSRFAGDRQRRFTARMAYR
jgi:hypothetical protein